MQNVMEDLNEQQLVTSAQLQPRERQLSNTLRRLQTTGPAHDLHTEKPMQATIEMPEPVYQKSAEVARKLGFTVEELIVQVLEREMASEAAAAPRGGQRVSLALIHSRNSGTLNLSNFDFDDLLPRRQFLDRSFTSLRE